MAPTTRGVGLVVFVVLCLAAGAAGGIVTGPEIGGWYRTLEKPAWQPPGWVFGPVWTTLYLMMAVAAWLIWKPVGLSAARFPLVLFFVQLVLNVGWSWIFFGMHRPAGALVELVALWLTIAVTTWAFFRRSSIAGWLMVPYLAWVSFAGVLNFEIWRLNG